MIDDIKGRAIRLIRGLLYFVGGCYLLIAIVNFYMGQFEYGLISTVILSIILALLVTPYYLRRRRQKREQTLIASTIDKYLKQALENMDTTAMWYNSENEANRELVSCLKSLGMPGVEYQYRLGNGGIADARVGEFLIEGKLSPDTADVHMLIGQMSFYSRYTDKLNIVIYGQLNEDARERLISEIESRYPQRVFLTYLDNPRRQRGGSKVEEDDTVRFPVSANNHKETARKQRSRAKILKGTNVLSKSIKHALRKII